MIGLDTIKWVDCCLYLVVGLKAGKTFATYAENNWRKFCVAVKNVTNNGNFLSKDYLMKIVRKQCSYFDVRCWYLEIKC